MRPADVFGVVVRSVGLVLLVVSVPPLCFGVLGLVLGGPGQTFGVMIFSAPGVFAGLWMLRGAQLMVDFAYSGEAWKIPGSVAGKGDPDTPVSR